MDGWTCLLCVDESAPLWCVSPLRLDGEMPEGVEMVNDSLVFTRPLQRNDSGVYRCEVGNDIGFRSRDLRIRVHGEWRGGRQPHHTPHCTPSNPISLIKLSHGFIGLTYRYEYESIFIGLTYRYEYVSTFIAVLDEEERHFMNQALSALKTSVSDDEQNRCCVYVYDSFFDQHNLNKTCQRGSSALPSVLLEKLCYCLRDTLFVSSSWNLLKDFLFFFLSLENLKQAD